MEKYITSYSKMYLIFSKSPVKILSAVALADQLKNEWDTWILSRRQKSVLSWAFGKFSKTILHGKSKLPEILVKSGENSSMGAFYSLVQKSTTSGNHLVFSTAFKNDRHDMVNMERKNVDNEFDSSENSAMAYMNEDDIEQDDTFIVNHDDKIPPIPKLSIGCSIRYIQDDNVEVGRLGVVDLSNPSPPTMY